MAFYSYLCYNTDKKKPPARVVQTYLVQNLTKLAKKLNIAVAANNMATITSFDCLFFLFISPPFSAVRSNDRLGSNQKRSELKSRQGL